MMMTGDTHCWSTLLMAPMKSQNIYMPAIGGRQRCCKGQSDGRRDDYKECVCDWVNKMIMIIGTCGVDEWLANEFTLPCQCGGWQK